MKSRQILAGVLFIFYLGGLNLFAAQETSSAVTKRYAVVMGANHGGKERVKLRYAVSDANSILKVMEELGGVSAEDSLLLEEPDVKTFYTEMGRLQERLEKERSKYNRIEVIFYYSGHSDDENVLLGKERISYEDFRETVHSMPADVHIAILDSCASGAFTRIKGGKKKLPFLMDEAYDMRGYAFLASSSATEASQESDLLKGSFFTHYLISGMRGAADTSQDGLVTLSEAYQFAFNETLAETAKTMSGPQHPNTYIQMSGTGDVVMTDIRKSSAILILNENISGRIFIHDQKNLLVVELTKPSGRKVELGLDEGAYRVINIVEGEVLESQIRLEEGVDFELSIAEFAKTDKKYTTPRGDRTIRVQKETVLRGKRRITLFAELASKTTSIYGQTFFFMGANFGLTFNNVFSVGLAGYGKSNFNPGLPGFGGVSFAYVFHPERKVHFRITALAGSGTASAGIIFYFFEPGVEVVLNLSRIVRIHAGLSLPLVDKQYSGIDNLMFNVGFQFGK